MIYIIIAIVVLTVIARIIMRIKRKPVEDTKLDPSVYRDIDFEEVLNEPHGTE